MRRRRSGKDGGLAVDESLKDDLATAEVTGIEIPQYSIWQTLGVWAAVALPMAAPGVASGARPRRSALR
jgi:hypothetical protein